MIVNLASISALCGNFATTRSPKLELRPYRHNINDAVQSQKAVSPYLTSNQILPFGFAEWFFPVYLRTYLAHYGQHRQTLRDKEISVT